MEKIVGVDFSAIPKYREEATVRMPNGSEVKLPLIKVRDANYAIVLLQRNDTIEAKFSMAIGRLKQKAKDMEALKQEIYSDPDKTDVEHETIVATEAAMEVISEMQKRVNEIQLESRALCDEIHEFLSPYLKGTGVIEQLKENNDTYTILVLEYMLNGMPSEESDQETPEENPTIRP